MTSVLEYAFDYARCGLCVLPMHHAARGDGHALQSATIKTGRDTNQTQFQLRRRRPLETGISARLRRAPGGCVSGNSKSPGPFLRGTGPGKLRNAGNATCVTSFQRARQPNLSLLRVQSPGYRHCALTQWSKRLSDCTKREHFDERGPQAAPEGRRYRA
jgi:hypothetical protein